MKFLPLTPCVEGLSDLPKVEFEKFSFPAGETHIRAECLEPVLIGSGFRSNDDLVNITLAANALCNSGCPEIQLLLPYVPYGRQDRVATNGDPIAIEVIGSMLRSCGFSKVWVFDPHSEPTSSYIDKCRPVNQATLADSVISDFFQFKGLICPDKGAREKTNNLGVYKNLQVYYCNKKRDPVNGKLTIEVPKIPPGHYLVADDICDAGGTFMLLRDSIPEDVKISLFFSIGLFTRGLECLLDRFENVWYSYSPTYPYTCKLRLWDEPRIY